MLRGIDKNIVTIVEVLMVLTTGILIVNGVFSFSMFIRAVIILVFMLIYKGLAHKLGIANSYCKLPNTKYKFLSEVINLDKFFQELIFKSIFKKYPVLVDIIYLILAYNPLLGIGGLSRYIYCNIHDIIVGINGNKDVFFKKYLNVDVSKLNLSTNDNKFIIMLKFVFLYPIFRILLLPKKIREKILEKKSFKGLFRVRFVVYIYTIILLYYGYYDFIASLSINSKLLFIYIYFALLGPFLIIFNCGIDGEKKLDQYPYLFPSLTNSCNNYNSISFFIYNIYGSVINDYNKAQYLKTYNTYSKVSIKQLKVEVKGNEKVIVIGPMYEGSISYRERGMYEKAYGISYIVFREFFIKNSIHYHMDRMLLIYKKGEEMLGKEYMEKVYGDYFKTVVLVYVNKLFLAMDIRRLLGFQKDKGMYGPKDELERPYLNIFDLEKQFEMSKELLNKLINYEHIPNKFISIELYNKLLRYVDIFGLSIFRSCEIEWGKPRMDLVEKGEEVLIRKLAFIKYPNKPQGEKGKWDPEISPMLAYSGHVITAEIDTREIGFEYDYEFLNTICDMVNKQYMEEYTKMTDEYKLLSESRIKNMLKKYKVF